MAENREVMAATLQDVPGGAMSHQPDTGKTHPKLFGHRIPPA
jgi:hypothetical protein